MEHSQQKTDELRLKCTLELLVYYIYKLPPKCVPVLVTKKMTVKILKQALFAFAKLKNRFLPLFLFCSDIRTELKLHLRLKHTLEVICIYNTSPPPKCILVLML